MTLRQDLETNKFIFTAELNPPKSGSAETLIARAKAISKQVSAINITDNSGASMKMCSLAVSHLVEREAGVEAIWQMTCRDRNRLGLQSDLLGAWALGLRNILVLSGDPADKGDAPTTKGCFDLKSEELLTAVNKMRSAKDFDDNAIAGAIDFCAGAAAHPGVPDLSAQAQTMQRRMDNGANFFQTQIVFDIEQLRAFAESLPEAILKKTLVGITPLRSLAQVNFINKNIWGVSIPDADIAAMTVALADSDPKSPEAIERQHQAGLKVALRLVSETRELGFKGAHIMAIGQEDRLATILAALK